MKNSAHLIDDLKEIQVHSDLNFASFDITDMYPNIPIKALIMPNEKLYNQHNIDPVQKTELITLACLITTQNYFDF
jgi:hypothetical protein